MEKSASFIKLSALFILTGFWAIYGQLDTSKIVTNKWVNIWPVTTPVSINGDDGDYENDFNGDPTFGFFILGPGHVVHPQDCNFYPYNPITNKWYKIDPPSRPPRACISTFSVNSQDSAIIWQYGGEAGHQLSQGRFDSTYTSILGGAARGIRLAAYSFNRNKWYDMAGPHTLPPSVYHLKSRYDPIHDISIRICANAETWVYNFHNNCAQVFSTGTAERRAVAVDTKRGLFYYFGSGGAFMMFNPENGTTTAGALSGTQPTSTIQYAIESMDYDPLHDVIIFLADPDCQPATTPSETWVFHCDTRQWEHLSAIDCPINRGRLAFNSALNAMVMFGGGGTCQSECLACPRGVWAYRYQTGRGIQEDMVRAPQASLDSRGGSVRLNWENLSEDGAEGYVVYRGEGAPFPHAFAKLTASSITDTSYVDAGAELGHAYSYRVCGIKAGVEGHLSHHLYTCPARVLGVVASIEDSSRICVSWEKSNEPDVVGYNVFRAKGPAIYAATMAGYEKINAAPVQDTFFNDLTANYTADRTARGYVVKAVTAFQCTSGVSDVGTTFPQMPERAWTISQSTGSGTRMAFRWQPPARTRILGVNLYRGTSLAKENTAGLITDTGATFWNMPPATEGDAWSLLQKTYVARAMNIYGQEGFCTDQFSPTNSDFGPGIATPSTRFDYSLFKGAPVAVEKRRPSEVVLNLNVWPNPFNPIAHIEFRAPAQELRAGVYDIQGRQVLDLTSRVAPGKLNRFSWNAADGNGSPVASGAYVIRLSSGKKNLDKKVFFIK